MGIQASEKVKVYDKGVTINGDRRARDKVLIDYRVGDMFAPQIDKTEPLSNVCNHFVRSVLDGTRPLTDGQAGLRVVRILAAAQTSLQRDGGRISL